MFIRYLLLLFLSWSLEASTLQLVTSSNPSRLNPLLATDSASSEITNFLFNGLVKFDKNNRKIIGDLAQSYSFKDDKTVIFKLKKGVKWHDGKPFSAQDVLFTYQTIISKNVVSPYASSFRFVQSVKALDDYTVEVIYKKPYFKALETWMMGILPKHILKSEKNIMNSKFNTHPIGTGPYQLEQLEYSKNILLKAFDDYFEGRPKIDTISFNIVADPMTRFLMLKSGIIDIDGIEPMAFERQLDKAFFHKFKIYEDIGNSYTYLGFNLRKKKFQNPKVREALSLAINREELVNILFFKHASVCNGPFLPTSMAYNSSVKSPKQNIKHAKELLKEAGYDASHPLKFEIVTSNSSAVRPYAAQILQHQLKKAGVIVSLRVMEWQAFLNMVVFPHKFDTVLLGWGLSPTPDPYMIWHSDSDRKGGFNLVGYHNKELNKMIEKSQSIIDRKKLSYMWKKMFQMIVDDNPYLFLYIPNNINAVNKNILHVQKTPSGIWHEYIKWEKQ